MQRKILIGGAIAALVGGGIYLLNTRNTAVAPSTSDTDILGPLVLETAPTSTRTVETPAAEVTEAAPKPGVTQNAPKPTGGPGVTPPIPSPAPFIATVYYDGTHFTPEVLTVPQNATVQFENLSTKKMWIASANHPTHDRYPVKSASDCLGSSFDQCTGSGYGTSWSFTFTELGEWRYHNHEKDYDTGKIIVLTKEKYLQYLDKLQN
jgi:hypothetical protein